MKPSDSPPVASLTISQTLRMLGRREQEERAKQAWNRLMASSLRDFLISTGQEEAS